MGFPRFALNDDWAIDIAATQFEQWLAAVAARVPSLKSHIPCISSLRISVRFGCGAQPHPKLLIINYSLLIKKRTTSSCTLYLQKNCAPTSIIDTEAETV